MVLCDFFFQILTLGATILRFMLTHQTEFIGFKEIQDCKVKVLMCEGNMYRLSKNQNVINTFTAVLKYMF